MGIDLITWRTRIGLNYYNACRPLQTRWRRNVGQVYQPKVVINDTSVVLKGCMTVFALSLMLQYIVNGWFRLKERDSNGKRCCHWWVSTFNVKGTVNSGGTKLLRVMVVMISLLLVMAGDVETNPGPHKKEGSALTLKAAVNALHSVCPKWYKIGVQLDVPSFQLRNIEKKSSDSMDKLCDTLDYWMSKETSCSWRYLVNALKAPIVDEIRLAKEIEEKHCDPQEQGSGDELKTSVEDKYQQEILNQDNVITPEGVPGHSPQEEQSSDNELEASVEAKCQQEVLNHDVTTPEGAPCHSPISESHTGSSTKHSSTSGCPLREVSQKPPFGCGCGKCTFFSFIERGCPTPIPSASSFPYLDLSRLTHEQQQVLRGRLQFESRKIMMQFQELVSATIKSFIRQNVPLDELVSHVMTLGAFNPVFKQPQVPLFQCCFKELKTADTIPKIFLVLKDYFSFFNYDIIEHIIKVLGTDEDKANLQRYKSNFEQYSKRRIYECLPYFGPMSETNHADIFVKLDSKYENYTAIEIKGFCNTLSETLHLSSRGVLRLCRVEKGCVQLTFQVPSFVQQKIFPLSRKQQMILNVEGVIKLTCADYQFPHDNCNFDTDANGNRVESLEPVQKKLQLDVDKDSDEPVEELSVCEPIRKKPRLDIDSDSAIGVSVFTDGKSTTMSLSEDPLDREIEDLDEPKVQSLTEAASNWNSLELHLAVKKQTAKFLVEESLMLESHNSITALHVAANAGNLEGLRYFISVKNCNPACPGPLGLTPLHLASERGHLDVVRYLVSDQQIDPLCEDEYGNTPLHGACAGGYQAVVEFLASELTKYAPFRELMSDLKNVWNVTPLHSAISMGHLGIVQFFISDLKCDPSVPGGQYDRTPLHTAAECGHLKIVKYLINEQGCDPSCLDDLKYTPLHCAASMGHVDTVIFLALEKHCDPMCENYMQNTPLHLTVQNGHVDIAKFLTLEMHCDPSSRNANNVSALQLAVANGHFDIVRFFISDSNCDPNVPGGQYGRTLLHTAAESGYVNIIKYLTDEQGSNPFCLDDLKYTPLHLAVAKGHLDIVQFFISDRNSDPNTPGGQYGRTPLHIAAECGHLHILKYLIDKKGCSSSCVDDMKFTPLHRSAAMGHMSIVKFLTVEKHCDPMCRDYKQNTPLHMASPNGHTDIVKFLTLEMKCDPNSTNADNITAVHLAVTKGRLDMLRFFISDLNCDPNVPGGQNGRNPVHTAAECGYLDIVKYLIDEQSCNPSCLDDLKYTPLHLAVAKGHLDIARFLISDKNCDPNTSGGLHGKTLLHSAAKFGHLDIVKYLTDEQGCNPSCLDDLKLTPLHCAAMKGHFDIVKFLTLIKHCDPLCMDYNQNTPLHIAALSGNIQIVRFFIEELKCSPDLPGQQNMTALEMATAEGRTEVAMYLTQTHLC